MSEVEKIKKRIEKRKSEIEDDLCGKDWDYPRGVVEGLRIALKLIEEVE